MTRGSEVNCDYMTASERAVYEIGFKAGVESKSEKIQHLTGDADIDTVLRDCLKTLVVKGNDYTQGEGSSNRLKNFNDGAANLGITPRQVLAVYLWKHLCAVLRFLKEGQVESEPIEGRILDCINYFLLLSKMVAEDKRKNDKSAKNAEYAKFAAENLCTKIPNDYDNEKE